MLFFVIYSYNLEEEPIKNQNKVGSSPGADWIYVKKVKTEQELEDIRGQYQTTLSKKNENSISLRCTRHSIKRGSCHYRMTWYPKTQILYKKGTHNHKIIPLTPRFPTNGLTTSASFYMCLPYC